MTKKKSFPEIQWEDDDDDFGKTEKSEVGRDADFESLLDKDDEDDNYARVGEKTKGIIASIPANSLDVMIDLGGKNSGVLDKNELLDESGQLTHKVGDEIEAFVLSRKGGEVTLSFKMSQTLRSVEDLEAAAAKRLPVKGRVVKQIKGGFEVTVLGKPAFCPISGIDAKFVENGEAYVGKDFEFLVEKVEGRGRNIVVNRQKLLKEQAEARTQELLAKLKPDTVLDGTVSQLRDFGAFVDIGGVEGMVHISELAHGRVAKPGDVVTIGDKVKVKVLKIERDDKGRPKIALSMKATAQDPWEQISDLIKVGETYTGKVVSVQAFGAFVEVKPGLEGLLHVSEMSWTKRVHHPSEVVKLGDSVTVSVKDIDHVKKRISLSMKQVEDDPWFNAAARFPVGKTLNALVERLRPFGAIVVLAEGLTGLVPISTLKRRFGESYKSACTPGKELEVKVQNVDTAERKVLLSLVGVEEEDESRADYEEYLASERAPAAPQKATVDANDATRTGSFGALLGAKLNERRR